MPHLLPWEADLRTLSMKLPQKGHMLQFNMLFISDGRLNDT